MRPALFALAAAVLALSAVVAEEPVQEPEAEVDASENVEDPGVSIADIVPSGEPQPVFFEGFQGETHVRRWIVNAEMPRQWRKRE
jgi:hypothetical protein